MMKLERLAPPGYNWQRELRWICASFSVAVLFSLTFFVNYNNFSNMLYHRVGSVRTLYDGVLMADFHVVVGGSFTAFAVIALFLIAAIILRYAYHYQGAKSIYLMRRLPSRWELHIRCVAMPLAAMLAGLLIALVLLLVYYWFYIALTPDVCLTPDQWAKLWNALIGG